MKAKYIIASLVAVCALAIGCTKDTPTVLDEVKVSSSYVGLTNNEGNNTKTITVNAKDSWSINEMPQWVTIQPASGSAGETNVTFTAAKAPETRQASIKIVCAGKEQTIIVKQEAEKVTPKTLTVSEALKVIEQYPDGSPVQRVKGIVCKIQEISPSYGNATYYLSEDGKFEDGKWLQVYRGLWMNGASFTKGDEFSLGDELTIEGVLMSYKGTPETKEKEAYVIEINKSLIKIASIDPEDGVIPAEGGDFTVTLESKGNGFEAVVPENAQEWLSLKSVSGNKVTYSVKENNAGPRSTSIVFKTNDGNKDYTAETTLSQLGKQGTEDVPFSVAEAIEYCQKLGNGNVSTADFFVKGIVSKVLYTYSAQYGTATFWISDDGEFHGSEDGKSTTEPGHDFEAYSVYYFNNTPWADGNAQIAVGAEVMICGKLTLYNDVAETSSKKAWLHSINGVKDDANGVGTLAEPFNAVGAIAAAQNAPSTFVYVNGIVSKIANNGQFSAQYGNGTFFMSTDGVYHEDKSLDFEAYRVLWYDNQKWVEGDPLIEEGQNVTVCGVLTVYNGQAETTQNKGYVYSVNPAN